MSEIFLFPENATIPLGESGIFECISMGEIVWRVNGTQTIDTGRLTQANKEELAREYNISISTQSDGGHMSSEVMILGNRENNLTIVECAMASAFLENINFDENQVAFLRIFGMAGEHPNCIGLYYFQALLIQWTILTSSNWRIKFTSPGLPLSLPTPFQSTIVLS